MIFHTDQYILKQFPEQEYIPFILLHCSGVTRVFARAIISLCIERLSIAAVEKFIKSRTADHIATLQMQVQCIPQFRTISLECLHKPYPSNDLVANCDSKFC